MKHNLTNPTQNNVPFIGRMICILLLVFFVHNQKGFGQLLTEPFNYTPHATNGLSVQSAGVWKIINSGDSILVAAGNLTHPSLPLLTSSGNSVTYGYAGTDYYTTFTSQTSGTVYYSFLLNVTTLGTLAASPGGYTIGLIDGTTSSFVARCFLRASGANYNVGISAGSVIGNLNWATNTLVVGTTYLVVVSHQLVAGTSNDVSKVWIDPTIGGAEPAFNATSTNLTGSDLASIQRIFLRQSSTTETPQTLIIDEIRVGTTWSSVTPVPSTTLADISPQPSGVILQGTPNVVLAGFTVAANPASDFTAVTITGGGSATSSDINTVRVFRDNNGNGAIDIGVDLSVSGAGAAFAASIPLTITGETGITTARNYLIVANVDAAADVSRNVSVSIGPGNYTASITPNNGSATGTLREIDAAGTPTITLSAAALTAFTTTVGTPSASQSYTVLGTDLSGNITVTPPAEFKIRKDANPFSSSPVTLTPAEVATPKIIDVEYDPAAGGSHSGNITHTSAGAVQKDKAVSGNANAAQPTVQSTVTFGAITNSSIVINFSGGNGTSRIVVVKDTNAVTYAPTDGFAATGVNSHYFSATDKGTGNRIVYDGSGSSVTVTGLGASFAYHVAVYEYNGSGVTVNYLTPSTAINNTTTAARVLVPIPMASQPGLSYTENFSDEANWGNSFNFGIGTEHWSAYDVTVGGTIPDGKTTTRSTLSFITLTTSGGLQRGSLTGAGINNVPGTLVLLSTSSGSRNACAIDIHADFTGGVSAGTLSFDWAAVANSTGDRPAFLKVYTSINGTTFTELAGAAVLNKANNVPASGSIVNVALPATLTGVANAIIRFYEYNGASAADDGTNGSRAKISIDNVKITAGVPPTKLVVTNISPATPTQNSGFSVTVQAQDAGNLPQNVLTNTLVTLSYLSGTGAFSGTLTGTIVAGTNNVVISGVIYNTVESGVSLTATATSGDPLTAGNSATFTVIAPSPVITVTGTLTPFLTGVGTQSASQPYTVSAQFLTANLVITPPAEFEIRTGVDPFSTSAITLIPSSGTVPNTTIDVRYAPTGAGPHSGNVSNASTGATTQNVAVSGSTVASEPTTASTVTFGCSGLNSIVVIFKGGNGSRRVVVASPTAATFTPVDLTDYSAGANSNYSLASPLTPADNRIVYDASDTTVTITGLQSSTAYSVKVYEYNGNGTIKNYLTSTFGSGSTSTLGLISYATTGSTYSQDFDGLPLSGTYSLSGIGPHLLSACPIGASSASGWQIGKSSDPLVGGTGPNQTFNVDNGSNTAGSAYSFGSTGSSDRSLGAIASGSVISSLGVALINNTPDILNTVTISYTGEQWRDGGSGNTNKLAFSYSLNGTNILTGTYAAVTALNNNSLVSHVGTGVVLDGNVAPNNQVYSATFTMNGNWLPGQPLILKWADANEGGSDDGLSIDDFSFSATVPVTPTAQDNNIYFPVISTTTLRVKWINGNGANHLVKMHENPGAFTDPSNFTGYSANPVWQNSGEQVVYNGTLDSVDITGLTAGTLYEFRVYGFNGSGVSSRYNITTEVDNPAVVFTESASPPTKLVFLSVNGGNNPVVNQGFSVVIQTQDGADNPQNVNINTTVNLTPLFGGSIASGTTSGVILAGTNTVTITGVKYDSPQLGVQLNASRSAGVLGLADGQSATFDVLDIASELLFDPLPTSGIVNTVVGAITVKTVRPDQTVDAGFSGSITIAYLSGPGVVSGTLTKPVVNGVATFNDIQFSVPGPYTLQASSTPALTGATSTTITITATPVMSELVVPKFMGSKSGASSNTHCTAIAVCLQIDNLVPNTFYDIRGGLDLVGANPGFYGAGNFWSGGSSFGTSNLQNAFQTNGSGSSGPFWVYFQPSGNASRFGAGQSHNVRIGYVAHGAGSTPSAPNFIGTLPITSLDIAATALTVSSGDDGAFLKGTVENCAAGKYILVYDNTAGTGQPLFSYQARQAIPIDTTTARFSGFLTAPSASIMKDVYMQNGASALGDFIAIIPLGANNPSGVQRIEARNANNTIFGAETDGDGIWPGGANTTTIGKRGLVTLTASDAPISIHVSNLAPSTACLGNAVVITGSHFTGATNVSFNGTSSVFTVFSDTEIHTTVPAGATTGTVTVTGPTGCVATSASFTVTTCGVTLTTQVLLEGFYVGGGEMNTLLYNWDQDPANSPPDPLITSDMTDTIYVSAMDSIDFSHALIDQQTGILKKNGEVVVTFGPAVVAGHQYYIKVNHHNHVETWSATPVLLTTSLTYNFLSAQSQAYANNQALTFDALYGAMYAGDFNQDGAVDGSDFLSFDPDNQNALGGYENSDLNGDGAVDGSDFLLYDPNNQNAVGAAVPSP